MTPLPHLLLLSCLSEQHAHMLLQHVAVEILLLYSHMRTEQASELTLSQKSQNQSVLKLYLRRLACPLVANS